MTQEEERERERERISLTLNDQLIGAVIYLCAVYLKGNRKIDTIVTELGNLSPFWKLFGACGYILAQN